MAKPKFLGVTPQRSKTMAAIRSQNTRPEIILRKLLFKHGYRYRIHRTDLPGKPDITLAKYKVVIMVNGCFWHYHHCPMGHIPKSNSKLWQDKIRNTLSRDKKNLDLLLQQSWKVLIVWECALRGKSALTEQQIINQLESFLHSDKRSQGIG